jgi:hypothetical protein
MIAPPGAHWKPLDVGPAFRTAKCRMFGTLGAVWGFRALSRRTSPANDQRLAIAPRPPPSIIPDRGVIASVSADWKPLAG